MSWRCCYTELKQPRRAQRLLCGVIERYDRAPADEISRYLSWLAESHIQLGEIDEAAAVERARSNWRFMPVQRVKVTGFAD